jgi:hypothetical protein
VGDVVAGLRHLLARNRQSTQQQPQPGQPRPGSPLRLGVRVSGSDGVDRGATLLAVFALGQGRKRPIGSKQRSDTGTEVT